MCTTRLIIVGAATLFAARASSDVLFFDIDADPGAWERALEEAGLVPDSAMDLGDLPDFGAVHHSDPVHPPLCHNGNDIVPSGFVPFGTCLDGYGTERGEAAHIDYVGPGGGFGLPSNCIVSGYFVDAFEITLQSAVRAVELCAITVLGSDTVDFTVFDSTGEEVGRLDDALAPQEEGRRWGILASDGEDIAQVRIHDVPGGGAEGIMGMGAWVEGGSLARNRAFHIVIGTLREGDVADLSASDNRRVIVRSGLGRDLAALHRTDVVVEAVSPRSHASTIDVFVESSIDDPAGALTLSLRNWHTDSIDQIGHFAVGTAENTSLVMDVPAEDYVRVSGGIELSVRYVIFAPFLAFHFDTAIDRIAIRVE